MKFLVTTAAGLLLASAIGAGAVAETESARGAAKEPAGRAETPQPGRVRSPEGEKAAAEDARPEEVELKSLESAPVGRIVHSIEPRTKRPFSFYVPRSYDKGRPTPLQVAFTGGGIGRKNVTRLWKPAEKYGQIVLAPDTWAVRGPPGDQVKAARTLKGWSRETGQTEVPNYVRDSTDILRDLRADAVAVGRAVGLLSRSYNVDSKLIVLTGYSGGAWVAYYTALAAPRRYAGACIRSGNFRSILLPTNLARARKLPITVVIGDPDLKVVLDETAAAEEFFKRHRFANFNVERLPNSGHDSRPEVAFNFVRGLQNKLLARRRKRWQGLCKSAQSAVAEGQVSKARLWFERAVTLERRFGFPGTAGRGLKELPEVSSQKKEPADN